MNYTFYVTCELLCHSYNCNICKIKREIKRMILLYLVGDECDNVNFIFYFILFYFFYFFFIFFKSTVLKIVKNHEFYGTSKIRKIRILNLWSILYKVTKQQINEGTL